MAFYKAVYRKGGSDKSTREVAFETDGESPDLEKLKSDAKAGETFVGVFPNWNAENGLTDASGKIKQFGPKK